MAYPATIWWPDEPIGWADRLNDQNNLTFTTAYLYGAVTGMTITGMAVTTGRGNKTPPRSPQCNCRCDGQSRIHDKRLSFKRQHEAVYRVTFLAATPFRLRYQRWYR